MTPGTARADRTRVKWGDQTQSGDDVSANGAYTHIDAVGSRQHRAPQPLPHGVARLARRPVLQAANRPGPAQPLLGRPDRGDRVPLGRDPDAHAPRSVRRRAQGGGGDAGHLRPRELLRRDDGSRARRSSVASWRTSSASRATWTPPTLRRTTRTTRKAGDQEAQEALLCIQSGTTLADDTRFKFDGHSYHLRDTEDMRRTFADFDGACDNSLLIAEQCDVSFDTSADYMPRFACPPGEDEHSWFVKEVRARASRRGTPRGFRRPCASVRSSRSGSSRRRATRATTSSSPTLCVGRRRTASASVPAAARARDRWPRTPCGITDLDPIVHGLFFERFLNPERATKPDFDIDFDERRRGEVIRYVSDKYGEDKVAQIVTYGTIKAKQALKDAARVLGKPFSLGERLTKAFPEPLQGRDMSLAAAFDPASDRYNEAQDFRSAIEADPDAQETLDLARGPREPQAPVGRPRGRRHHVERAAHRHHPHHAPGAGRRDHHPVRLPDVRGPRARQDGLPGAAHPDAPRRRAGEPRRTTARASSSSRTSRSRTRRPSRCWAGATPSASSSSTAWRCGSCCARCGRTRSRTSRRCLALYRPGPMGMNSHTNYALRKNGHPARRTRSILSSRSRCARSSSPPTGSSSTRSRCSAPRRSSRATRSVEPTCLRKAMGKKDKAVLDKEFGPFRDGMIERGYSEARVQGAVGHPRSPSPTTRSTRHTPPRTASSASGPPTSRRTIPWSSWPRS